ncbi:MAG TPA: DUF2181 domain-containing protein [Alphaproteobacteria bacterium]|nr:DUF2181 domain-containing protein [Alphaproteobacteria bacterium]
MQSIADYFGLKSTSDLAYAHAVNTRKELEAACADPTLHVAEGDVMYASADALPALAHPWQDILDLDIQTFLTSLNAANKAIKLDFTSPAAIEPTLQLAARLKLTVPVIVHANIFSLLNDDEPEDAMEPEKFLRLIQTNLPTAVISLGWSLKREHDADGMVEDLLIQQVSDLFTARLTGAYEVDIRAGYTSGWERGAALILDPIKTELTPAENYGGNVVSLASRRAA